MKKLLLFMGLLAGLRAQTTPLDQERILGILPYGQAHTGKLGQIWTLWQGHYFLWLFLAVVLGVAFAFLLHYLVIGPKQFAHSGQKIPFFSLFNRIIHWIAGVSFTLLVPTGLIMIFGDFFGGGAFVRFCRITHSVGCVVFMVAILPMLFMWFKDMILSLADFKWLIIMGGYLSKEKKPVPAYKFNAGQKTWFWIATLGGFVMIASGGILYFNTADLSQIADFFGLYQISLLRLSALVHNFFGLVLVGFFIVHLYMSLFAIKGSLHSMIDGNKELEEVKVLHSLYLQEGH
ncbi:formate dehydrogenase subunit gamma [Helicobacter ailurogastricus]|uniref:Putative formate dehydrogenase, cytochrome B subunit n=1 Tax=Helicobacter ailurogastricus TaxID=1578720 RepID=A0A0K2XGT0_9HELI|nr:formate dehydrogenase subunit gamma [Helicobacter ailurogastricus]CRF41179.1 Putative formate dehydrogenase, cytochrome B subunit [Helicobacter ailurogastricus]CRF42199.1 Putative formate dehydrogenase, cytochrome B subunit [Helicobacter ailurogastricus]CRF43914.1 Putative formate dehydrogenase, cytochrome B subunit [Helicobacter ailurogastricus]